MDINGDGKMINNIGNEISNNIGGNEFKNKIPYELNRRDLTEIRYMKRRHRKTNKRRNILWKEILMKKRKECIEGIEQQEQTMKTNF